MRRASLERWYPRIATDAELGRKDRRMAIVDNCETGACSACEESSEFCVCDVDPNEGRETMEQRLANHQCSGENCECLSAWFFEGCE
jgi:hypothetical protein